MHWLAPPKMAVSLLLAALAALALVGINEAGYRQYGPDAIDHRGLSCRDVWSSEVSVDAAGVAADPALVLSGLPP